MSDDNRLGRIEDKLDKVIDAQAKQGETLAVNTQQLAEHMRRTELLESRTEKVESLQRQMVTHKEFAPVSRHVNTIQSVSKFLGKILVAAGGVKAILVFIGHIFK